MEKACLLKDQSSELLWGMDKFYDSLDWVFLGRKDFGLGYPVLPLQWVVQAHLGASLPSEQCLFRSSAADRAQYPGQLSPGHDFA